MANEEYKFPDEVEAKAEAAPAPGNEPVGLPAEPAPPEAPQADPPQPPAGDAPKS